MRFVARFTLWCVVAGLLAGLSGCAGFRLHSETRAKQGDAATKAWSEVDLRAYFQAARDERSKLIELEAQVSRERVLAQRDSTLRAIVDLPLNAADGERRGLIARVQHDLDALVGTGRNTPPGGTAPAASLPTSVPDQLRQWDDLRSELVRRAGEREFDLGVLQSMGAPVVGCSDLASPTLAAWRESLPPQRAARASATVESLDAGCKSELDLERRIQELATSFQGSVGQAWARMAKAERRVAVAEEAARKRETVYRDALAAYEKAWQAAQAAADKPLASASLKEAAARLAQAFDAIAALQDAFSAELIAKERLDKIDSLLTDLQESNPPGADATRTEVVVLLLPRILDDVQAIERVRSTTTKPSLLIRRDIESTRWTLAKMEVASQRKAAALERAIFESTVEEAILLQRASERLALFRNTPLADRTFLEAVALARKPDQQMALYDAAGRYLDGIGRQRATTENLLVLKSNLGYERSLAYSESNAAQWELLIGAVVGQAAEFSAGGQKIDNYKDIIQTLVMLWIGYGVNK